MEKNSEGLKIKKSMGVGSIGHTRFFSLNLIFGDKMKKFILFFMAASIAAFSFGCGHFHDVVGNEQKSEIPEGVRVKIGSPEVKEGDTVDIFKKMCPKNKPNPKIDQDDHPCNMQKVGTSKVIKVLTKDTAIINTPNFKIENDMTVEKSEN